MRFLVVDDDWLARGGVVKAIESIQPDAAVIEAASLHDAYVSLQENPATDLVILDLNLAESRGIDTLVEFRSWCEAHQIEPRTVVLSGASDGNPNLVADVLANHGTGFILKGTKAKVFEHALALTVDGGVFVPEEILRVITPAPAEQSRAQSDDRVAATELHAEGKRDRRSPHSGDDVQEDRAGAREKDQATDIRKHRADARGEHGVEARCNDERESRRHGRNRQTRPQVHARLGALELDLSRLAFELPVQRGLHGGDRHRLVQHRIARLGHAAQFLGRGVA